MLLKVKENPTENIKDMDIPYQHYQYQAHLQEACPWNVSALIVQEYGVGSILPEKPSLKDKNQSSRQQTNEYAFSSSQLKCSSK